MSRRHTIFLALIVAVAAFLRFEGLSWGLPNARHWFSYHPDEFLLLAGASRVNLFAGRLDPDFYNYGSFLIYLISTTALILDAYAPLHSFPNVMARMTLIGRAWVALAGVGTVYVVYLIGRRLGGPRAGLLAAAVMAVIPMHAVHSHFATVDVPATFWVAVALYNALRWPEGRRAALWCGLAAGFAAGTKYNAGLVLLAGWAAVALARTIPVRKQVLAGLQMTGLAVLGFLVTTPGVLLFPDEFQRDFGYEAHHVQTGHGLVFTQTGPGWWYHLSTNLWQGLGAFLPIAAGIALAWTLLHAPRRGDRLGRPYAGQGGWRDAVILASFALPYFVLISLAAVRFQRYDMPLLPVLAAVEGVLLAGFSRRWLIVPAVALLGTLVLAQGDVSTMASPAGDIQMTYLHYRGDVRDAVADWFDANVPAGATVGLTRLPWFFSPPFSVANGGPQSERLYEENAGRQRYRLVTPDADGGAAFSAWPDYVVLSDYEYGDPLRLMGAKVPERASQVNTVSIKKDADPEAVRLAKLWNAVVSRYELVGVWRPAHHVLGMPWYKRGLPPHDSFYSFPTLIVFRRDHTGFPRLVQRK